MKVLVSDPLSLEAIPGGHMVFIQNQDSPPEAGKAHRSLFIVTSALTACQVALYSRVWGRSTSATEFVMRLVKRNPHGPDADGSFKALNCYEC